MEGEENTTKGRYPVSMPWKNVTGYMKIKNFKLIAEI